MTWLGHKLTHHPESPAKDLCQVEKPQDLARTFVKRVLSFTKGAGG